MIPLEVSRMIAFGGEFPGVTRMSSLLAAALVLAGGIGIGLAIGGSKRLLGTALGRLGVAVGGTLFLLPGTVEGTYCRIASTFERGDRHPPELCEVWVGWHAQGSIPYCRLELEGDGTGRCVFWHGRKDVAPWRVTRWDASDDEVEITLESGDRQERMRGQLFSSVLLLEYFGSDGLESRKDWRGPLHLVPEDMEEAAREEVAGTR